MRNKSRDTDYAPDVDRGPTNFDFRIVTLLLVLVTRQDLLKEYLDDGREKDKRCIPAALHDITKWKRLRLLFPPAMLAEMLYLFEVPKTQESILQLRIVFQTMINLEEYDFDGCPNLDFVRAIVELSRLETAELNPAGVAVEPGSEN
jgi:hypothetical protein